MSVFVVQLDRVWTAYPDDVLQALCQAYDSGTKVVELVMQSDPTIKYMRFYSKYFIDFNDMRQYNAYTNKTRKIKLLESADSNMPKLKGKLAKIVATACVPNKEKYTVEVNTDEEKQKSDDCALILTRMKNEWLVYGSDIHEALQRAYCAGYAMVEFVVLSDPGLAHMKYYSKYVVDFTAMTQYNVYTNKTRKIRFVSKEDKDKRTYQSAPGKLAKDVQAVKTLGTDVPKNLGTKNLDVLSLKGDGQSSPSINVASRGNASQGHPSKRVSPASQQSRASGESQQGRRYTSRQGTSGKFSAKPSALSEAMGFGQRVVAGSEASMSTAI